MVRDVFRLAKENAPAIIFIDEVDAIATARFDAQTGADREVQRILMELLNQVILWLWDQCDLRILLYLSSFLLENLVISQKANFFKLRNVWKLYQVEFGNLSYLYSNLFRYSMVWEKRNDEKNIISESILHL